MRVAFVLFAAALSCLAQTPGSGVRIQKQDTGYVLLRDGKPYFIKGAGGSQQHLDALQAAGGNSLRVWSPPTGALLDAAQQHNLTVMVGLNVGKPRHGFSYENPRQVQQQRQEIVDTVHRLKSNPAVLIWALGNELELNISTEQRIEVWKAIEDLARAVKAEDPDHPVIAVLAGPGQAKLRELDQYCPSLDAVGINTYGALPNLRQTVEKQGFKRPYIVTEFGAHGHWEVVKTTWGVPIEDTSSQKEDFIIQSYQAINNNPQCLGSYVFLWGQKQEKTHTWYGLFLPDGRKLGGVDAMQLLWTGKWPEHRCPVIDGSIMAKPQNPDDELAPGILRPGARLRCSIFASDLDGDPVTVQWELRKDVSANKSTGGDPEPPTPPLDGAVVSSQDKSAVIAVPDTPGDYRIFVYVFDKHGGAATANLPIEAK
ncbi:MAG TPA: glycoside hydrolase family 2 TIM barrel-domain containing protein [Bryobacteraceae bacterium]|nr:glycoside hydrolase family 2 TIM barrel-domain containing protein [Bryobacteraceae bacterium]